MAISVIVGQSHRARAIGSTQVLVVESTFGDSSRERVRMKNRDESDFSDKNGSERHLLEDAREEEVFAMFRK